MKTIFKHPEDNLFSFIDDYKSDRLIEKIINSIYESNEILELDKIDITKRYDLVQDISSTELDCILNVHIKKESLDLDASYNLEIPSIKNSVMVKDRSRFIQKQLRDSLFVTDIRKNNIYTRILPDIDIELVFSKKESEYIFDVRNQSTFKAIPLYLYFLEDGKPNQFADVEDDAVKASLDKCAGLSKDNLFKEFIVNNSYNKYRQTLTILNLLYKSSELLRFFTESISDLIFKSYLNLTQYDPNSKKEIGLNLKNRRVRSVEEIVFSSIIKQFIEYISYDIEIRPKNRRSDLVRRIEVTKDLYDFIQIEQLTSPYANLAGKSKISLTGPGAFNRDNVPTRLKLLHDSLFGNIDPVTTPDRDGTGVILYLASCCKLNKFGMFESINNLEEK